MDTERWELREGDAVLGTIQVSEAESDFPWLHGRWEPTPRFDAVRALFDAELALADDPGTEWEAAYRQIYDAGIRFHYPDGKRVPEFLLHIEGDHAWFRWSDEPFPDGGVGDPPA